jgi:murein L,D-transpeptidase YafK
MLLARATTILVTALAITAMWSYRARGSEPLYPQALMNWMVEGTFHAMIVDKSQQRLSVWRIKDGEPALVESYRCSTGENDGDKWVRGDMKTPEGVYLFCSVIDGRRLPPKYGQWAFTTDYPNFVDRRRGKSGDGIWLHGRDKPLAEKPDSNGCIALENQDLVKASRFIRLQDTPLIVVKKLHMIPRSEVMNHERKLRDFVESWRQSWESRDVDEYMSHYSPNFQSCWFDFNGWKEKKKRLSQRYRKIRVRLGDVYLYRQNGMVTAVFSQTYSSDGFRSSGLKVLYIVDEGGKFAIYSEDYHQPVDDPFPVRTLLARVGADAIPGTERNSEFRIRLVSTDEPEQDATGDMEMPRPTAPSRGVVLDRLASAPIAKETSLPPTEITERVLSDFSPERLIVARMMPSCALCEVLPASRHQARSSSSAPEPSKTVVSSAKETTGPFASDSEGLGLTVALRVPQRGPQRTEKQIPTAPTPVSKEPSASPANKQKEENTSVREFLNKWKLAWEQKDLDSYAKMYHPKFRQGRMDYKSFLKSKRAFFGKYRTIRVEIDKVETAKEKGQFTVKFLQSFQGDEYRDKGWKSMVLAGGKSEGLRIVDEQWSSYTGATANSGAQNP